MPADFIKPHEEAAAIIAGKPIVTKRVFDELLPELRGRAFTITGIEDADVLQHVRDSIAKLPRGTRWDDAKAEIATEMEPYLGGVGAERRATLLLRTQAFTAFQASNWRVAQEDEDTTHLQYLATEDDRVRASHLALNGITLPKDDPFWDQHFPPWEWNCRCRTRTMNPDQVDMEREKDADRSPEDQNVITGPALTKLREGHLLRDGRAYDVSADPNPDAFHWHPEDLRVPLGALHDRYDDDVWQGFKAQAKAAEIQPGVTVMDWLLGEELKPRKIANPPPGVRTSGGYRIRATDASGRQFDPARRAFTTLAEAEAAAQTLRGETIGGHQITHIEVHDGLGRVHVL